MAIYEPPQLNTQESFELLELSLLAKARTTANAPGVRLDGRKQQTASADAPVSVSKSAGGSDYAERLRELRANEQRLDELLETLGLTRVGCIFTDLVPDKNVRGGVLHYRGTAVRSSSAMMAFTFTLFFITCNVLSLRVV